MTQIAHLVIPIRIHAAGLPPFRAAEAVDALLSGDGTARGWTAGRAGIAAKSYRQETEPMQTESPERHYTYSLDVLVTDEARTPDDVARSLLDILPKRPESGYGYRVESVTPKGIVQGPWAQPAPQPDAGHVTLTLEAFTVLVSHLGPQSAFDKTFAGVDSPHLDELRKAVECLARGLIAASSGYADTARQAGRVALEALAEQAVAANV